MNNPKDLIPVLLQCGRRDWPANTRRISPWLTNRLIRNHEIWVIWRGRATVSCEGEAFPLTCGNLFWFHPGKAYEVENEPDNPVGTTFMVFNFTDSAGKPAKSDAPPVHAIENFDPCLAESLSRRIVEHLWESYIEAGRFPGEKRPPEQCIPQPFFTDEDAATRSEPFCPMPISIFSPPVTSQFAGVRSANQLFQTFFKEMIYQVEHQSSHPFAGLEKHHRKVVSGIVMQMRQNPGSIDSLSAIAMRAGYSADHFSRTFKRVMGCSPQQFLMHCRINKAKDLLQQTSLSIKEIAFRLGYCNAYFFSRQFRAIAGATPSKFRQSRACKTASID